MAKTFQSEGRQVAKLLNGILVVGSIAFYYYVLGTNDIVHFYILIGMFVLSIICSEIVGNAWTKSRRSGKG